MDINQILAQMNDPEPVFDTPEVPVAFGLADYQVTAIQADGTYYTHFHKFANQGHAERMLAKVKASFAEGVALNLEYWELAA